jgi:hypothetical protein
MSETPAPTTPGDAPPGAPGAPSVEYKGAPLEAGRGPGLGCFYVQLVVLAIAVVITPLSVAWGWPEAVSAVLLLIVIVLLFFAGQTMIFLGRLVAAERRAEGRRRPLASSTRTVGELEDERATRDAVASDRPEEDEPGGQSPGS